MKYKITKSAFADLNEIWLYTFHKWSAEQADKYFEIIIQGIETLSLNPNDGKKIAKIKTDYFYYRIQSHYVFFKQNDEIIEVIRILHKMMDFSRHLE